MSDGPIEHPDLAPPTGFTWGKAAIVVTIVSLLAMWV